MTERIDMLVVGGGGREHALVWKLAQSPRAGRISVAPGNAGTARIAHNVPIAAEDIPGLLAYARANQIGLTVVGPEAPLAAGLVDHFRAAGLPVFGPTQAAAQLEASKAFGKQLMRRAGIPTADFAAFRDAAEALAWLDRRPEGGVVVKADGLAAGKGVIVCDTRSEAQQAVRAMLVDEAFGAAGQTIVIEERLSGPELSLLAFCDGRTVAPMVPARDHKRIFDGDRGPNTGGMGAFAPTPGITADFVAETTRTVLQPAVDALSELGAPYVGVLYAGLMLTDAGVKVLEFNCRFGDPETQAILPLLAGDLLEICLACIRGTLQPEDGRTRPGACAAVVLAAPGYPGTYERDRPIVGLDAAAALPELAVFHAGTALHGDDVVTAGGRVLAVSGWAPTLDAAVAKAYAGAALINFPGVHYRRDIGR